jgi:uncharacterized protein YjdB
MKLRFAAILLLFIFAASTAAGAFAAVFPERTTVNNHDDTGDDTHPPDDNNDDGDSDDDDDDGEPAVAVPIEVSSIRLNRNTLDIKTNETIALTARILPSNADNTDVLWFSSDSEIVGISPDGEVTGISEGIATITVLSTAVPWIFDTCEVRVEKDYINTIALGRRAVKLAVDSVIPIAVITAPSTAYNQSYTWTVDDDEVAEMLPGNIIRALKPGVATFTATADDYKEGGRPAESTIVVTVITAADYFCTVGKSILFRADIISEDPDSLIWNVYRLTNDGLVRASANEVTINTNRLNCRFFGHAVGEYRIEITDPYDERNVQIIHINVKEPVRRVIAYLEGEENRRRRRTEITVNRDGTDPKIIKLSAAIEPETATYKDVTWRSSRPDVATIDENGVVTPISVGSTVITCTSVTDNKRSTFTVTVKLNPTEITLDRMEPITMRVGTSTRLRATVDRFRNSSSVVVWSSSNPEAIAVANGKLTAVGVGSSVITAASASGNVSAFVEVESVIFPSRITTVNRTLELAIGETDLLSVGFEPYNATETALVYESRDIYVATVDEDGNITAVGEGTTTVTATTANGRRASVIVVVR